VAVRASRLLSLLLLLQLGRKLTAEELAERLGVSVRTVYRDIEALAEAGVPIRSERGPAGGFRLREGYRSKLPLTADEAEALLVGAPGPAAALGLGEFLAEARLKVLASLPRELRERARRAERLFYLDEPRWFHRREESPLLAELAGAVWAQHRLDVEYRRQGEVVRRLLDPLGLVLKAGSWYLVARRDGEARVYRVSRLERITVLDEDFERPRGFDLARFWLKRLEEFETSLPRVEVTVRVRADALAELRSAVDWTVRPAIDGAAKAAEDGWVELMLPFERLEYAYAELIPLGGAVEVVAPPELRERVARAGRGLAEVYAQV
jgi:predicted DNA-binding transcriptional regulator YafY